MSKAFREWQLELMHLPKRTRSARCHRAAMRNLDQIDRELDKRDRDEKSMVVDGLSVRAWLRRWVTAPGGEIDKAGADFYEKREKARERMRRKHDLHDY